MPRARRSTSRSCRPGCSSVDLEALAAEFGTPLFVYDEDHLRARCREFVAQFGAENVAYAGKAFLCTAMARLVAEEGLNLDVATGGELHVALHAGFPAERLVFHGNNKSDAEIAAARDAGVGVGSWRTRSTSSTGSSGSGSAAAVFVRVTPGVEAHTHEYIETGTERSKFGFSVSTGDALEAVRAGRGVAGPALRRDPLPHRFAGVPPRLVREGGRGRRSRSPTSASARPARAIPLAQPRWRARRAVPRDGSGPGDRASTRGVLHDAVGERTGDGRAGPRDRRLRRGSRCTGSGR